MNGYFYLFLNSFKSFWKKLEEKLTLHLVAKCLMQAMTHNP